MLFIAPAGDFPCSEALNFLLNTDPLAVLKAAVNGLSLSKEGSYAAPPRPELRPSILTLLVSPAASLLTVFSKALLKVIEFLSCSTDDLSVR